MTLTVEDAKSNIEAQLSQLNLVLAIGLVNIRHHLLSFVILEMFFLLAECTL